MNDYLFEAKEELKRLEHIIYVSLKYTRTGDVLINALNRLVGTFDMIMEAFLEKAREEGRLDALPKSPGLRVTKMRELYPEDKEISRYLEFYTFIRNLLKSPHLRRQEYRRHVGLIVELNHATAEINIDNLVNCEKFIHQFFRYAWDTLVGKEVDEFA
ncbi:hypothetical protein HYT55_04005 [Candidatus Woesearchaeota archaeon]|nr:hypothetical protein [Candidatus Woesearchaeota archaeon]